MDSLVFENLKFLYKWQKGLNKIIQKEFKFKFELT
jgi:hypothetical protein